MERDKAQFLDLKNIEISLRHPQGFPFRYVCVKTGCSSLEEKFDCYKFWEFLIEAGAVLIA